MGGARLCSRIRHPGERPGPNSAGSSAALVSPAILALLVDAGLVRFDGRGSLVRLSIRPERISVHTRLFSEAALRSPLFGVASTCSTRVFLCCGAAWRNVPVDSSAVPYS